MALSIPLRRLGVAAALLVVTTCEHNGDLTDAQYCAEARARRWTFGEEYRLRCTDGGVPDGDAARDAPGVGDVPAIDAAPEADASSRSCSGAVADPCWRPLEGLPEGCLIEVAERPAEITPPAPVGCGDGCLRWGLGRYWSATERDGGAAGAGPAGAVVAIAGAAGPGTGAFIVGLYETSLREMLFAVRYVPWAPTSPIICQPQAYAGSRTGYALIAGYGVGDDVHDAQDSVYAGSYGDLPGPPVHIVTEPLVGGGSWTQRVAVSDRGVAWEIQPSGIVQAIIDGTFVEVGSGAVASTRLVGDHLLYEDGAGRLWHWTPETGSEVYLDIFPSYTFAADDADLVWWFRERAELWTTTLARTPAGVSPALVRPVTGAYYAVAANRTAYLTEITGGVAYAVHVAELDGSTVRRFTIASPDEFLDTVLTLTATELVVATRSAAGPAIYSIDVATLPLVP